MAVNKVISVFDEDKEIKLLREDPYGLMYIYSEDVKIPEKYRGAYTTEKDARLAVNHMLQEINLEPKKVKKVA